MLDEWHVMVAHRVPHQVASELVRSSIGQTPDWSAELAPVARPTGQNQDLEAKDEPLQILLPPGGSVQRDVHHRCLVDAEYAEVVEFVLLEALRCQIGHRPSALALRDSTIIPFYQ